MAWRKKNKSVTVSNTAEVAEMIRSALVRADKLTVAAPLTKQEGPGGITIGYDPGCTSLWGVLSGSSSPYSWTEVKRLPNGTWQHCCRSGTAVEVNGAANLNGTYQQLHPDCNSAGGFRFQDVRTGSGTPKPGPGTLSVVLYGCLSRDTYQFAQPSGAVTFTKPDGTTSTPSTNHSITLDQTGTYTVAAHNTSNYNDLSTTFSYSALDGQGYTLYMVLTPSKVLVLGQGCGPAGGGGINVAMSGKASGTTYIAANSQTAVYLPVSPALQFGDQVTVQFSADRFNTYSETTTATQPYFDPNKSPRTTVVGGTIPCSYSCGALTPASGYHCLGYNEGRGGQCFYPCSDNITFNTPIGAFNFSYPFDQTQIYTYTTKGYVCCQGWPSSGDALVTQGYPFEVSADPNFGNIQYKVCDPTLGQGNTSDNACISGGLPTTQGYGCNHPITYAHFCKNSSGSNVVTNVVAYCPNSGKSLVEFDIVGTTYLDGHYTIVEASSGGGGGGGVQPMMASPHQAFNSMPSGRIRVGFLAPCLNAGGAESVQLQQLRGLDQRLFQFVGLVVTNTEGEADPTMLATTKEYLPVQFGLDKIASLAAQCDVIVSWVVEDMSRWMGGSKTPYIFIDHFAHDAPIGASSAQYLSGASAIVGVSSLCTPGWPT